MKSEDKIMMGLLLVLFAGWLSYKIYLLQLYPLNKDAEIGATVANIGEAIPITFDSLYNNDRMTFYDISYTKPSSGFTLYNDVSSGDNILNDFYFLDYTNDSDFNAAYKVDKTTNLYTLLLSDGIKEIDFKSIDIKSLLEKNRITNEIELFNYMVNSYNKKISLFSTRDEIEMAYFINEISNKYIIVGQLNFIEGDIKGYMYTIGKSIYIVNIINNDDTYSFTFINNKNMEYFTKDNIKSFISTINFE